MDITCVEKILNEVNVPKELYDDKNVGTIIRIYNNSTDVIEELKKLNSEQKLTEIDIYDILNSKYPIYMAWLVIDSKSTHKRYTIKTKENLANIINNCKENYQAFGVIFTVTQIGNIEDKYLIAACEVISKSDSVIKMYHGWHTAVGSEYFVGGKNMVKLTEMITNAITDENASYACETRYRCIDHCQNPMLPTLVASKTLFVPKEEKNSQRVRRLTKR